MMKKLVIIYVISLMLFSSCSSDKFTGKFTCVEDCYDGQPFTLEFNDDNYMTKMNEDDSGSKYPFSIKKGLIYIYYGVSDSITFKIIDNETIRCIDDIPVWKGLYKKKTN